MSEEITMIVIAGFRVGLVGLEVIFAEAKEKQFPSDDALRKFLLERVREMNYVPKSKEEEYARALWREYKKFLGETVDSEKNESAFPEIKVLGPGCPACENLERDVRNILAQLGIAADVEHIRDLNKIAEYGMVRTPGLVINNELVLNGRVPRPEKLAQLLQERLVKNS